MKHKRLDTRIGFMYIYTDLFQSSCTQSRVQIDDIFTPHDYKKNSLVTNRPFVFLKSRREKKRKRKKEGKNPSIPA